MDRSYRQKKKKIDEKVTKDSKGNQFMISVITYFFLKEIPSFELNRDNLKNMKGNCVKFKDWQNLALWILADGVNPKWVLCKVRAL